MSELLEKVLTDKSARSTDALHAEAANNAKLGYGWAGDAEV